MKAEETRVKEAERAKVEEESRKRREQLKKEREEEKLKKLQKYDFFVFLVLRKIIFKISIGNLVIY